MIELSVEETGLWIVTLNRPDKANALTSVMLEELLDIATRAQSARGVILTGTGKVFCAGADLGEAATGLTVSPLWEQLSAAIAALPCLSVVALNGTLAGGGNGMALACDLRIAVASAKVFYPVMRLGHLPQPSDVKRMAALIGPARTKLILAGGQKITAQQAHDFGLIDCIVEPAALMQTARDLMADSLGAKPEVADGILTMCRSF